ncbi:MAG: molybdate ABC transporter substrate-binding protein [Planctomycetota bacterium]|nr:molybdate ABC transporter substrate-binding protein [Planctomycetota bacterium]
MTLRLLGGIALGIAAACMASCSKAPDAPPQTPSSLRVFAASSLLGVMREMEAAYESQHPGINLEFSFAGSNQLRTQLEQGARADVYLSADRRNMDAAAASKVVSLSTIATIAFNRLAVIVPRENRQKLSSLADIARPGLKILVADKAVPAGSYALKMLEQARAAADLGETFVKGVEANIVSREENVAGVVAKVALGEADAGFAYASDAAGPNKEKLTVLTIPDALSPRAEYVGAVVATSTQVEEARGFLMFVVSERGGEILVKGGFESPRAEQR